MEEEKTYIVRIVCQNKSLFITFKESELNITKFPEKGELKCYDPFEMHWLLLCITLFLSVANAFGLKFGADVYSGLILTDNLGFPFSRNLLVAVIKNFHNGSMFYINIEYQISDTRRGYIEIVTPTVIYNTYYSQFSIIHNYVPILFFFINSQILEDYFRRQNMSKFLKNRDDEPLDDSIRKHVVNGICDFMVESFGNGDPNNISKQQKSITCDAAIKLFIGLKSKDSDNALVTSLKFVFFELL